MSPCCAGSRGRLRSRPVSWAWLPCRRGSRRGAAGLLADYATGRLIPGSGSAAEIVAGTAAGAHVVKALHMFAGASWPFTGERASAPVVAICGDDPSALEHARSLIADLGGRTAMIGTLASARQAEEAAGFVMRVVAAGANPRFAVPDVNPALLGITETVNT
jgi:8-hydroxy-5-deazaflavin:NADPH oxidoreductase